MYKKPKKEFLVIRCDLGTQPAVWAGEGAGHSPIWIKRECVAKQDHDFLAQNPLKQFESWLWAVYFCSTNNFSPHKS